MNEPRRTHRVSNVQSEVRWVRSLAHVGRPMTLQQLWRITDSFEDGSVVSSVEWRDVPTVPPENPL